MGPEAEVHKWLKKEILKEFPSAYVYKPRAGTYGKRGVADFIFGVQGLFIAVEVKANITKSLTRSQLIEMKKVKFGGNLGYFLFGYDEEMLAKIISDIHKYKLSINII